MHQNKQPDQPNWFYWMYGHSVVNGLGVYLIVSSIPLMIFEMVSHFIIDTSKCKKLINVHVDQGLHVAVKIIIAVLFSLNFK